MITGGCVRGVKTEDVGQRVQAFAIAMIELVGVDEVERGGVP